MRTETKNCEVGGKAGPVDEGRNVWLLKDDSPFGSHFLPSFLPFRCPVPCPLLFGIPTSLGRDCGQVPHSHTSVFLG